jgi:hypothetical protein
VIGLNKKGEHAMSVYDDDLDDVPDILKKFHQRLKGQLAGTLDQIHAIAGSSLAKQLEAMGRETEARVNVAINAAIAATNARIDDLTKRVEALEAARK